MGKEQQMIEYMVQDLVEMLTEAQNVEYDNAMRMIYDSEVYDKLLDIETGLYRESPSYVYGLLQDELNFGHIVQAEVQFKMNIKNFENETRKIYSRKNNKDIW